MTVVSDESLNVLRADFQTVFEITSYRGHSFNELVIYLCVFSVRTRRTAGTLVSVS